MAGSRAAMVAALPAVAEAFRAETVVIDAYDFDCGLRDACSLLEADWHIVAHRGLVKLLDARRLWRDFQPLLAERIGREAASRMRIHTQADELKIHTLTFEWNQGELTLHGERELTAALFGAVELDPLANRSGPLAETLRRALPLPLPLYGLNYV